MRITDRHEEGVVLLELDGVLDGPGGVVLREEVRDVLDQGARKLVLDLQRVRTMNSSGLGELIRCKQTSFEGGASIKLLHVEDKVQEILEMTRLIGVFETFDDEIDVLASFREP